MRTGTELYLMAYALIASESR